MTAQDADTVRMNVYKDSGFRMPYREWMGGPCLYCGDPIDGPRWMDWMLQAVWHERCAAPGPTHWKPAHNDGTGATT